MRVEQSVRRRNLSGKARFRSLGHKYFVFTALLLIYVVFIFIVHIWQDSVDLASIASLGFVTALVAAMIAKYTNRILSRPLALLREGITSVREGRLEPIQISRTGDEIEFLGESFNAMIEALAASQNEVSQYQESLEERIQQRTEALKEATQRALAASKAKSEFLANMSHELRTPMSGLLGMIDIVLDSRLSGEQRDQLTTAKGCANSLLALLNDLLDLSKIEAGKMILEEIPFDVRSLVDECVKSFLPKAKEKGIALRSAFAAEVPYRIAGDPLRLRQILANLLSNAVKFTDRGCVEVRLAAGEDRSLQIDVTDTGIGIPTAQLSAIFQPFTQADGSISRRYGGTGLGLTITRKVVEMCRGTITVDSEPGRGSTFRVRLPAKPAQAGLDGTDAADDEASGASGPVKAQRHAGRILVVEDNVVNQKVVTAILRKHGYEVVLANHGGEALETLETADITLVLMDVQMPVVDGLEATRMIRSDPRWKDLPIVAMTAHAMTGDRDLCLQAGMDAYISKPVTSAYLLTTIETQLHLRAQRGKASGQITLQEVSTVSS
jgi:signal transduction histidine kinase/CheY-like chemotaxis protein